MMVRALSGWPERTTSDDGALVVRLGRRDDGPVAGSQHRFYGELAEWWPLISPPEEYAEEAAEAASHLRSASIPVREVLELGFVLRDTGGHVRVVHETHRFGLFSRDVWLRLLAAAGFEPRTVLERTSEDRPPREFFLGDRPG